MNSFHGKMSNVRDEKKKNKNIQTSDRRKQHTRSKKEGKMEKFITTYNYKKNSHHFYPLKNSCLNSIENQKKSNIRSFQVLTYTHTLFTIFSLESMRTQASISLACKSRLASCVILALGILITSILKEKQSKIK